MASVVILGGTLKSVILLRRSAIDGSAVGVTLDVAFSSGSWRGRTINGWYRSLKDILSKLPSRVVYFLPLPNATISINRKIYFLAIIVIVVSVFVSMVFVCAGRQIRPVLFFSH